MTAIGTTRLVTVVLTMIGFGAVAVSMATGDISAEGSVLLDLPWGRMSLIDIYIGVALLAGWAFLREDRWWIAALWVPVFVLLGHAGTALYAAIASLRSSTIEEFLLGARRARVRS